jgi:hypothetical protein
MTLFIFRLILFGIPALGLACIVWSIRSLVKRRFRSAAIVGLIGLAIIGVVAAVVIEFCTMFDPYIVEPISASPAAQGSSVGHAITGRALLVVSSNAIVCVADPGASFHHEVLWIVARPRTERGLIEYSFQLPENADPNHVNGLDADVPDEIVSAATESKWR